jgi:hypothetical protein
VIVSVLDSQWVEFATFGSELVKVTSHEVDVPEVVTVKVVLFVVSVRSAAEVAPVSVLVYSCPETAEPPDTPQLPPV